MVDKALQRNLDEDYLITLTTLSREHLTPGQMAPLERDKKLGPNYLGCTASQVHGHRFNARHKRSNGFTSSTLMMPAADRNRDEACHTALTDFSQGEMKYMIIKHLIWDDIRSDELLSYSKDTLFLVVHALNRWREGQGRVTMQYFDRRRATIIHGGLADFYIALELYKICNVDD